MKHLGKKILAHVIYFIYIYMSVCVSFCRYLNYSFGKRSFVFVLPSLYVPSTVKVKDSCLTR